MPIFSRIPLSEVGERPPLDAARAARTARRAGTGLRAGRGRGAAAESAAAARRRRRAAARGQPPAPAGQPPPPPPPPSTYAMCYAISVGPDPLGAVLPLRVRAAALSRLSASRGVDRRLLQSDQLQRQSHLRHDRDAEARLRRRSREDAERASRRREQCLVVLNVNFLNNADIDGTAAPPDGAPNVMMAAGGTQLDKIFEANTIDTWQFHVDWKNPSKTKLDRSREDRRRAVSLPVRRPADQLRAAARHRSRASTRRGTRSCRASSTAASATASRSSRCTRSTPPRAAAACAGTSSRIDKARKVTLQQQGTYAPDGFYPLDGEPGDRSLRQHRHRLLVRRHAELRGTAIRRPQRRRSARRADDEGDGPGRRGGVADEHAALGGLHDDRDRSRPTTAPSGTSATI